MEFEVRYSSIKEMLELIKKLRKNEVTYSEIDKLLDHKDYQIEFARYKDRITKNEYIDYFLNFSSLKENKIKNEDLRIHHKFFKDLYDNLDYYFEKTKILNKFTKELFEKQINIALKGLPDDIKLDKLNFIFTVGIGQSFGYVHKNNMHFDYLQLIKNKPINDFCSSIAHEVHHVGMNLLYENIDLESIPLEELFYLYFSGEGLAVKYCNNAKGVLSKSIYDAPQNTGLDSFTWEYLNNDFENTMKHFKETINNIRSNKIENREELENQLSDYWMNPYIKGQDKKEIPKLRQFRLYSFGNEIWGIIHDCFGKEKVFEIIKDMSKFVQYYNIALEKIGYKEYRI